MKVQFESVCCVSVLWSVKAQFVESMCSVSVLCLSLCVVFQCSGR